MLQRSRLPNPSFHLPWFLAIFGWLITGAGPLLAADLARVSKIVIQIHQEVSERAFVTPLIKRLSSTLTADVTVVPSKLGPVNTERDGRPIPAEHLFYVLANELGPYGSGETVHVILIQSDMRTFDTSYVFANSLGGADARFRLIAVSLARLTDGDPDITAARVARLVTKNVAWVAGYSGSELCVFGFSRNLRELDALPENFCEPDLSILATGGIAKR